MVDVVADLTAQTDAVLDAITQLVTEIQKNVAQLAALQKDARLQTEALAALSKETVSGIDAQITRLKQGSDAALSALRILQSSSPAGSPTVAPAVPAAIVQDSAGTVSGPAAEAPVAAPAAPAAPVPAASAAPVDQAAGTGEKA